MNAEMTAALVKYIAARKAHYIQLGVANEATAYGFTSGPRYVRIYKTDGVSRSVVEFIDGATGEVFRADSWKKCGRSLGRNIHNV